MGTAAISSGDYIHAAIEYADLLLVVGHDLVEKPPFIMQADDKRTVIHVNFNQASVRHPTPLPDCCELAAFSKQADAPCIVIQTVTIMRHTRPAPFK